MFEVTRTKGVAHGRARYALAIDLDRVHCLDAKTVFPSRFLQIKNNRGQNPNNRGQIPI